MNLGLGVIFMWTFAVSLSGLTSVLICGMTLKRKYSRAVTLLGYGGAFAVGFAISFLFYFNSIENDFGGIIVMPVLIWGACLFLNTEHWSSKLFVAIMATLISNVSTVCICGPVITFIDSSPTPHNVRTILIFIGINAALLILLFTLYKGKLRGTVRASINILDGRMGGVLFIALVSFLGFCMINVFTGSIGTVPTSLTISHVEEEINLTDYVELRLISIAFHSIISLIFIFEFWYMISAISRSSRVIKTKTELNFASKIQQDMLPCIDSDYPNHPGFDIYANMQPAKEVGGDFYDFFLINKNTLAVVIADVSDKGVPAALFMVIAKTIIKNSALSGKNPKEVFETANSMLCENNETCMFVTAFLGYLDIPSGTFSYVNAGHNLPLLSSGGGSASDRRFEWLKAEPGFVLAGMKDISYKLHEITLLPGDELFLYTDGLTEAINFGNEMFGDQRLLETMNSSLDLPLKELVSSIKHKVDKFTGGMEQSDDITMLVLRFLNANDKGNML